jgi:hypothetical protein
MSPARHPMQQVVRDGRHVAGRTRHYLFPDEPVDVPVLLLFSPEPVSFTPPVVPDVPEVPPVVPMPLVPVPPVVAFPDDIPVDVPVEDVPDDELPVDEPPVEPEDELEPAEEWPVPVPPLPLPLPAAKAELPDTANAAATINVVIFMGILLRCR